MRFIRFLNSAFFFLAINSCFSISYASNNQPENIGNYALPYSQQPGAFLSFGQNTLGKGLTQFYLFADDIAGDKQHYIDAMPGIVYGFLDNLSIYLVVPYAVRYQQENNHSSGLNDILVQLEYAFYNNETSNYSETATVVFNTTFPTGSVTKNPPIGLGAQAFFLGGTFSRMYTDWLGFVSPGIEITTTRHGLKSGNSFLYQLGIGKNISYETSRYIFSGLLELNGTYYQKNKTNGVSDPDSGGNIIYATPSIWISTQHLILQAGMGWAIAQHWNGEQPKSTYLIACNLGWTFS